MDELKQLANPKLRIIVAHYFVVTLLLYSALLLTEDTTVQLIQFFTIFLIILHNFDDLNILKQMKVMAFEDETTHLPNKLALKNDLQQLQPSSVLLIDIKQFSLLNDTYGEVFGDLLLLEFSKVLQTIAHNNHSKVYRVGADQFITLNLIQESYASSHLSNDIFAYLKNNTFILKDKEGESLEVSIAVRIALVNIDQTNINEKFLSQTRADLALKYGKKHHKEFVEYQESLGLEEATKKELEIVEMVKDALQEKRVIPVFQKIQKERGDSYECLVRIQQKDGSLLSPFFFLETEEQTSYYFEITKVMIAKSCQYFSTREESFSLNFSFQDIGNEKIIEFLIENIKKYNVGKQVIIELLETEFISEVEVLQAFIKKIREYGVQIAIDDFGTGYSNFVYLAQIEPDFIKIDGSLIKNIDSDEKAFIIAKNINNFAKELGCQTIAEFVHSQEVFEKLQELDIDGFQGYFISKPSLKV